MITNLPDIHVIDTAVQSYDVCRYPQLITHDCSYRYLIEILTASTELPEDEGHGVDVSLLQGSLAVKQVESSLEKFGGEIPDRAGVGEAAGLGAKFRSVSEDGRSSDPDGRSEIRDAASQIGPNKNVSGIEIPEKNPQWRLQFKILGVGRAFCQLTWGYEVIPCTLPDTVDYSAADRTPKADIILHSLVFQ